jgi:hypothetical protein
MTKIETSAFKVVHQGLHFATMHEMHLFELTLLEDEYTRMFKAWNELFVALDVLRIGVNDGFWILREVIDANWYSETEDPLICKKRVLAASYNYHKMTYNMRMWPATY